MRETSYGLAKEIGIIYFSNAHRNVLNFGTHISSFTHFNLKLFTKTIQFPVNS